MPERTIDLLFRFLRQNDGCLSRRARAKEFAALSNDETARTFRRLRTPAGEHHAEVPTLLGWNGRVPLPQEAVVGPTDVIAKCPRRRMQHDDVVTIVGGLGRSVHVHEVREACADQRECTLGVRRSRLGFAAKGSLRVHTESMCRPGRTGGSVLRFYGTRQHMPYNCNIVNQPSDRILDLIDRHGLVRARDVHAAGIPTVYLTRLVRAGILERVARGLYARADAPADEHASLAEVAKLAPRGVVCLLSALAFHELGTQNPHRVWLALPHKAKPPASVPVQLVVARMHPRALAAGVATHRIEGVPVPIFDPSKTVADLFKFRSRVGLDVALEALRAYWNSAYRDQEALRRYARLDGVENVMQPYLEATAA